MNPASQVVDVAGDESPRGKRSTRLGISRSSDRESAALSTQHAQPADQPAGIEAVGVTHAYDDHQALQDLSLAVEDGSFCTLLGPSGSGKTTLLRILAGLMTPTEGRVNIRGADVTRTPVQDRAVGFVFQHYALFPHLTVAENIAFPLSVRSYTKSEQRRLVAEMIDFVDLSGLTERRPGQLSGGQQQRVAIARALVFQPDVLLLDEPLGALDRRLRQQLGTDLRRIQREASTTAVYVTHDQEEALLLSDTVAVINDGRVQQVGSPVDVYRRPTDRFVATFLGDTNLLAGTILETAPEATVVDCGGAVVRCVSKPGRRIGERCWLSVRPEDVRSFADGGSGGADAVHHSTLGPARVTDRVFLGGRFRLFVRLEDGTEIVAEVPYQDGGTATPGESVVVGWPAGTAVIVD